MPSRVKSGATLDDLRSLGSTGILRAHGWRTYEFEFVTLPGQNRVLLGVTNQGAGTFLLDWVDCRPLADLPDTVAHAAPATPQPVAVGRRTVRIFDEPGFPERSSRCGVLDPGHEGRWS
jgi:hypothetical protein